MNEYTQIERLIRILQILSSGRKITTRELHERFEGNISLRTIQRDLLTLEGAGIPLVSEKINANENIWYLLPNFRSFVPIPLTTSEYLAAYILKSNLKIFKRTFLEEEIESLINKIDQLVPDDLFLELNQKGARELFENYTAGVYDYAPFSTIIDNLISAILNSERCYVQYQSLGAEQKSNFSIEPAKLVYYSGGLYLIAFMRHYKRYILLSIQRIKKLKPTGKFFTKDYPFDEEQFWSSRFGLLPGEKEKVVLQFDKSIANYIDRRAWHSSQKMSFNKTGDLLLTMEVALSPELISWIMSWHQHVLVISPKSLAEFVLQAATDIVNKY